MALLFMDGFDHYLAPHFTQKWDVAEEGGASAILDISQSGGRRGGGAFRCSASSGSSAHARITKAVQNSSSLVVGFAFSIDVAPSATTYLLSFLDGTSFQGGLRLTSSLTLQLWGNGVALTGGTSTETIPQNTWVYIEVKMTFASSVSEGACVAMLNGVQVINATGGNTAPSGNAYANRVRIGANGGVYNHINWYDDLYVCDLLGDVNNDFLGDVRIERLRPQAVGTYDSFSRSPTVAEATAAYPYWRVHIRSWNNSTTRRIAEIQMRATVGGANQCTGGTASSSSGTAAYAFDNNADTICEFSSSDQWIQYAFPSPVSVAELAMQASSSSSDYGPSYFNLEASNDGVTFETIAVFRAVGSWISGAWRTFGVVTEVGILKPQYPKSGTHFTGLAAEDKQSFTVEGVSELPSTDLIVAVQVNNYAMKSQAGGAAVANLVRSGLQEEKGPTQALIATPRYVRSIHELNPATGQPWLLSEVLNMEVGLEVVS